MNDTPRTYARVRQMIDNNVSPEGLEYFARDLERELNAANAEIERLSNKVAQLYEGAEEAKQRIKRLEEAGDAIANAIGENWYEPYEKQQIQNWRKAKEAKP